MQYKILFIAWFIINTTMIDSSPAAVNVGGTGRITSTTAVRLLCAGTTPTGTLQVLAANGQNYTAVLKSTGPAALPGFTGIASSMIFWITTLTASASSSVSMTSSLLISSNFFTRLIIFFTVVPASADVFVMDWSINNGSSYINTGFKSGVLAHAYNSTTLTNSNSTTTCPLGISNAGAFSGFIIFTRSADLAVGYVGQGMYNTTGQFVEIFGTNTSIGGLINNIRFSMSGGATFTGTITAYGAF